MFLKSTIVDIKSTIVDHMTQISPTTIYHIDYVCVNVSSMQD